MGSVNLNHKSGPTIKAGKNLVIRAGSLKSNAGELEAGNDMNIAVRTDMDMDARRNDIKLRAGNDIKMDVKERMRMDGVRNIEIGAAQNVNMDAGKLEMNEERGETVDSVASPGSGQRLFSVQPKTIKNF